MNKFLVLKGNHSNVIRDGLLKRGNWEEVITNFHLLNFLLLFFPFSIQAK